MFPYSALYTQVHMFLQPNNISRHAQTLSHKRVNMTFSYFFQFFIFRHFLLCCCTHFLQGLQRDEPTATQWSNRASSTQSTYTWHSLISFPRFQHTSRNSKVLLTPRDNKHDQCARRTSTAKTRAWTSMLPTTWQRQAWQDKSNVFVNTTEKSPNKDKQIKFEPTKFSRGQQRSKSLSFSLLFNS